MGPRFAKAGMDPRDTDTPHDVAYEFFPLFFYVFGQHGPLIMTPPRTAQLPDLSCMERMQPLHIREIVEERWKDKSPQSREAVIGAQQGPHRPGYT